MSKIFCQKLYGRGGRDFDRLFYVSATCKKKKSYLLDQKAMFAIVGSRAREGYGSVRERDVGDGGRVPEREAPISNTSIQRRPNGKMSASQPVQQQPVQVNSLISVNP